MKDPIYGRTWCAILRTTLQCVSTTEIVLLNIARNFSELESLSTYCKTLRETDLNVFPLSVTPVACKEETLLLVKFFG